MCSVPILLILLLYLRNFTVSEIDEQSIDFHQGYMLLAGIHFGKNESEFFIRLRCFNDFDIVSMPVNNSSYNRNK